MLTAHTRRAIRADVRRTGRALVRNIARAFAPFEVVDTYGTCQRAYSVRAAAEWLPYCSPVAMVSSRITGRVIVARVQA